MVTRAIDMVEVKKGVASHDEIYALFGDDTVGGGLAPGGRGGRGRGRGGGGIQREKEATTVRWRTRGNERRDTGRQTASVFSMYEGCRFDDSSDKYLSRQD